MSAEQWRDSMSEKDLHEAIVQEAVQLGWMHFHAYDMRRSDSGFPDLLLLHPETGRRLAIEVKSATGTVKENQGIWLEAFALCGIPAMVVRPCDRDAVREVLR